LADLDSKADLNTPETTPVAGATPEEALEGLNNSVETIAPVNTPAAALTVPAVQPSIADKQDKPATPGTIYDTDNYHKPVSASKKTHPFIVVLWIVVILILLAAGGWALWTYVLSNYLVI